MYLTLNLIQKLENQTSIFKKKSQFIDIRQAENILRLPLFYYTLIPT